MSLFFWDYATKVKKMQKIKGRKKLMLEYAKDHPKTSKSC